MVPRCIIASGFASGVVRPRKSALGGAPFVVAVASSPGEARTDERERNPHGSDRCERRDSDLARTMRSATVLAKPVDLADLRDAIRLFACPVGEGDKHAARPNPSGREARAVTRRPR
jgi:hypothetical protein